MISYCVEIEVEATLIFTIEGGVLYLGTLNCDIFLSENIKIETLMQYHLEAQNP